MRKPAKKPEGPTKTAPPDPGASKYGRRDLLLHGWLKPDPLQIEPGKFLIGTGEAFRYAIVPEGNPTYMGVALDRPEPSGLMARSDLGAPVHVPPEGTMGQVAAVDTTRPRVGFDRADRAHDLADVLERLLARFRASPRHAQTGFLCDDTETPCIIRDEPPGSVEPGRVLRCTAAPAGLGEVVTARGAHHASHLRGAAPPGLSDDVVSRTPQGFAGRLSLLGQISCIWAVFRDRLRELAQNPPSHARIEAIQAISGRNQHPLTWSDEQIGQLELVRGELQQWKGFSNTPKDLITQTRAAKIAGVSSKTISRRIKRGTLTGYVNGRVSEREVREKILQIRT